VGQTATAPPALVAAAAALFAAASAAAPGGLGSQRDPRQLDSHTRSLDAAAEEQR
jgi:hypothetical protein